MQGQRPPPFACEVFASIISCVRTTHIENCVIYVLAPCQHSNQWANTLVTAGSEHSFVNKNDFLVLLISLDTS